MRIAALLVSAALATATAAHAAPRDAGAFIPDGQATAAPRGFVEMCGHDATFCGPGPVDARASMVTAAIVDTPQPAALWRTAIVDTPQPAGTWRTAPGPISAAGGEAKLLNAVDRRVNRHVAQVSDQRRYGVDEYWVRSGIGRGAAGDCEDIAIEKRYELLAAGFAADRLAFAVVYLPRIGLHTVLIARTDEGDMVLDSRTPYVERWDRTSYAWVSIQTMGDPMSWHGLRTRAPQMVAATIAEGLAG